MTWRSPDTYHSAGNGRGTATFKFYEGRGILRRFHTEFYFPAQTKTGHRVGTAHPCEDLGNPLNHAISARAFHDAAVRPGR